MSNLFPQGPPDLGGDPTTSALLGAAGGGAPPPDLGAGGGQGGDDLVSQAIDLLTQAMQSDLDAQEKDVVSTCLSNLTRLPAQNQKNQEAAMGTTPAHKAMAKAAGGEGY